MKMLLAYMMTHPGKKLIFMGQDFAYTKKWSSSEAIDWNLLNKENYREVNDLMRDLNTLYKEQKALYKCDMDNSGFEWINEMDADRSIISYLRKTSDVEDTLLVVCNFTPIAYDDYPIGVPYKGRYKEIFSTEDTKYGGYGIANPRLKNARPGSVDGRDYYISVTVEPLSVAIYNFTPLVPAKKETEQEVKADTNTSAKSKKSTATDTIVKKAREVSMTVSKKADEVSKTVSLKAESVSRTVTSKANEVIKKAGEARDLVSETVTITADEVKKAATKNKAKKVDKKAKPKK